MTPPFTKGGAGGIIKILELKSLIIYSDHTNWDGHPI